MAKGGSVFAIEGLEGWEIAGEYRRAVAGPGTRPSHGYCGSRPSCTSGRSMILIVGSMTCSTSSVTRPSSSWRGRGSGAIEGNGRRGSTGSGRSRSSPREEGFLPQLRDDLKARQFAPLPVRERMIPKPGRASCDGWASRPRGTASCKRP